MEITIRFVLPRVRRRFVDDIADTQAAGITAGCGAGIYCPDDPVTRGQMAAFLNRSAGTATSSVVTLDASITAADGWVTIAAVDIDVPGVGGSQRVVVTGEVTAVTDSNGINACGAGQRCYINTRIRDATSGVSSSPGFYAYPPDLYHQELVGRHAMFTGAAGPRRYELQVDLINGNDALQFASPTLIVMTFPLSGAVPLP